MKRLLVLLFLVLASCDSSSTQEKIQNLNGYWIISKVQTKEGKSKEFGFSSMVDYIEIKDKKGFRKKLSPRFGGKFAMTNDAEQITVKNENDSINLYYSTEMDQWKETLVSSEKDELVFINEHGNRYTYKRFTGILDKNNGEKEQ